jgi:hypothetical protein
MAIPLVYILFGLCASAGLMAGYFMPGGNQKEKEKVRIPQLSEFFPAPLPPGSIGSTLPNTSDIIFLEFSDQNPRF